MNIIRAYPSVIDESVMCPYIEDVERISESYADFLHDESRLSVDTAKAIFFPRSTDEVSSAISICNRKGWNAVVSGGRTGIVGGAVPLGVDAIISLEKMKRIIDISDDSIKTEAGITLEEFNKYLLLNKPTMFYPVDPTETTAQLGGTISTNASGARTYFYGPTRKWVRELTVVLADGSIIKLRRGDVLARNRNFEIEIPNKIPREFSFSHFEYPQIKSTTGFELRDEMDAIDLFIGSEGIIGIITEAEMVIIPIVANRLYTVTWTHSEQQTLELVKNLKKSQLLSQRILAIEYFDPHSLDILRERRIRDGSDSSVPKLPEYAVAALFLDLFNDDSNWSDALSELEKILKKLELDTDNTWSGFDEKDLSRMKAFRHALPETVNEIVSQRKKANPKIHKLSTDIAVPEGKLEHMISCYRNNLADTEIEYVIFGHIGDNHLHLNMLPKNDMELEKAKSLYREFAIEAVKVGGVIAAEHGIGRLKRDLMKIQYPQDMLEKMWELKRIFDPGGILNPGVLLPDF